MARSLGNSLEIFNLNIHKASSYHRGHYHSESSCYHFTVSVHLQGLSNTLMVLYLMAIDRYETPFDISNNTINKNSKPKAYCDRYHSLIRCSSQHYFHFKKTFSTKYNHVAYNVRMIKYKRPFGIKQQQHLLTQSVAKIQLTTFPKV
uniref:Uncharacterized protein n=1 Tax=Glossina pallidipes TaxID=7398 RepID=A0A1A9ZJ88_GLOPL